MGKSERESKRRWRTVSAFNYLGFSGKTAIRLSASRTYSVHAISAINHIVVAVVPDAEETRDGDGRDCVWIRGPVKLVMVSTIRRAGEERQPNVAGS